MIAITDGHEYLWDEEGSVKVSESFRSLPDKDSAISKLKLFLPNYADEIDEIAEKFQRRSEI